MDPKAGIVIAILLVLCFYYYWQDRKYSYKNTIPLVVGAEAYNVHQEHLDQMNAARILAEITSRNARLIEYLEKKYAPNLGSGSDPTKNNRIDIIGGSGLYYGINPYETDVASTMQDLLSKEVIQERINQLVTHYNSNQIFEISPLNKEGVTSYTEDKKRLILCLRKKQANKRGEYELHDINTIMFVVLHELSHMMNNTWGHPAEFWELFKFMLENAVEINIYTPVDYSKYPINYCGLEITFNPLFAQSS
jgi:hypothetical protein